MIAGRVKTGNIQRVQENGSNSVSEPLSHPCLRPWCRPGGSVALKESRSALRCGAHGWGGSL